MEMFEKNPSGGYRTNGMAIVGDIVSDVPGGKANRPSSVTHIKRFCLDFGVSLLALVFSELSAPLQLPITPRNTQTSSQFHIHLISIVFMLRFVMFLSERATNCEVKENRKKLKGVNLEL